MIDSIDSKEQDIEELFHFDSKNVSDMKLSSMLPANEVHSKVITPDEYQFVLEEIKLIPNFIDSSIKRSVIQSPNQFIQASYIPQCKDEHFSEMISEYSQQWFASLNSQLVNVFVTNSECDNIETFDSIGFLANIQTINNYTPNANQQSENNAKLLTKLQELRTLCYKWRKIKGDGNCYYRTVIFSYIENLILMNNVKELMALIYDMHKRFKDNHFQTILVNNKIESRNVMICIILVYLALINPTKSKDSILMSYEIFLKCLNNITQFDNGLIIYLRYLYYIYLKDNEMKLYTKDFCVLLGNLLPAEYETNEGMFLFEKFYNDFLLKLYKDAEKIIIYLTPYILDINLNILMFEEESNSLQGLKFLHKTKEGAYQNIVTILYRKNHYDLAYNETFVRKFYQYLSAFKMENDELTVLNETVYVSNKSEILRKKSMEYNALNSSFSNHLNRQGRSDAVSIYESNFELNSNSLDKESKGNSKFLKQGIIMKTSDIQSQSFHLLDKGAYESSIGMKLNNNNNLELNQSIITTKHDLVNNKSNENIDNNVDANYESDPELVGNAQIAGDLDEEKPKKNIQLNDRNDINNNHVSLSKINLKKSMTNLNHQPNKTAILNNVNETKSANENGNGNENPKAIGNELTAKQPIPYTAPIKQLSTPKVNGILGIRAPLAIKGKVQNTNSVLKKLKEKKDNNANKLNDQPVIPNPNPNLIERVSSPAKKKAETPKKPTKPKPKFFKSTQLPTIKEQEEIVVEKKNLVKKTDNFDANEIKVIVETKEKKATPKIVFPNFSEIKIVKPESESSNNKSSNPNTYNTNDNSKQTSDNSIKTTIPRHKLKMGNTIRKEVICRNCKVVIYNNNRFTLCNDCLYQELLEKIRNEYKAFIKQIRMESISFSQYINHKTISIAQVSTTPEEVINIINMQKAKKTDLKESIIKLIQTRTCVICYFFSQDKPLNISLPCKCHLCSQFCLSSYIQLIILKDSCDFICLCNEVYDSDKEKGIFKLLEQYQIENYKRELVKKIINRSMCMNGCGRNSNKNTEVKWIKLHLQNENEAITIKHFMCSLCSEKTKANNKLYCVFCRKYHIKLNDSVLDKKDSHNPNDCIIF